MNMNNTNFQQNCGKSSDNITLAGVAEHILFDPAEPHFAATFLPCSLKQTRGGITKEKLLKTLQESLDLIEDDDF